MSENEEISAFSMYSIKRKKNENPIKKKFKKQPAEFVSKINDTQVPSKCFPKHKLMLSKVEKSKKIHNKIHDSMSRNQSNETKKLLKKIDHKKSKQNKKHQKKTKSIPCLISSSPFNLNKKENLVDPMRESKITFQWLIHSFDADEFFNKCWEEKPVHIKRKAPFYYKSLISTPIIDKMFRDNYILFNKNIDITSYSNGVRETHNPSGRAYPSIVWDYYNNGCSIRMLNPQTFIPQLHKLNASLQECFGCFVGANFYLTPPGSQGFAPHYDDIEAFILQVEGKKRWRLYKPRNKTEYLARYSSKNFDQSEIGQPILDTIVEAGDLLYFPRGTIHQGETIDNTHSLHITLSVYQKNCWADFLEKLLPDALSTAIQNDVQFRKGLPINYLNHIGLIHSNKSSVPRTNFINTVKQLCSKILEYIDVDKSADIMGKSHIHDFLPPVYNQHERQRSVLEDGERMTEEGLVENRVEIEPDTEIRLLRSHCARLINEDQVYRLYYSCENSKEYHEYEQQFFEVSEEFVPAIRKIMIHYPRYVRVDDLPITGEDNKVQLVQDLWEKGIVVTKEPLEILE